MKRKTLYVSDLDGTLLGEGSRLSQTSEVLLNHAISRGALISVATARTPATVNSLLRNVNFEVPLIVMTGAALWDKDSGRYSEVQYFSPEKVREIVAAYRAAEDGGGFLYTLKNNPEGRDLMEIYHIGTINAMEHGFMEERISNPFKRFLVPDSGVSDIPEVIDNAVLFFGMQPNAIADKILERLYRIKDINPMSYHDWYGPEVTEVEAFPRGATKAKAIMRLKEKVGADRVVVFGDNMNDLTMMGIADWSVAVSNAIPEVKDAADEVIGSNTADAVARYILEDLNIRL